jgi:hypothetical protein
MKRLTPITIPASLLTMSVRLTPADEPYLRAYPHLLAALHGRHITPTVFVEAAHMVYGWMPAVLVLSPRDPQRPFVAEAALVDRVRAGGGLLTEEEIETLAASMTEKLGSVIGLSKLLHFVCPEHYAIWDTRVHAFLLYPGQAGPVRKPNYVTVNRVSRYWDYLGALRTLVLKPDFPAFHQSVNQQLGYPVSAMRAAELVMFSNAPAFITKKP